MWFFFATVAVMAVIVYAIERLVVPGIWPRVPPKDVVVDEMTVPEDLVAQAMSLSEQWARDDALGAYVERRKLLGSWDAVRRTLGRFPEAEA